MNASPLMSESLRSLFMLDENIHFLNHGSFGACPRPVFEVYQAWQRRLERQPVLFLGREMDALDRDVRQSMGVYLNTSSQNLVFIPNATHGVNIVARSLDLKTGDEVLTSDHEYGACDYTWEFNCGKSGAHYIHQLIPLPIRSSAEVVDQFWQGVTPRTRLIFLSHITSPTALRMPVEAICAKARQAGIATLIDGAHAPGQIDLDLDALGADFYVGNAHKWMLCPKGAGFLYVRSEMQPRVEPLVVSWGYHAQPQDSRGSQFLDRLGWTGTHDPSAWLSIPSAIQFMQAQHWDQVRQVCHTLLRTSIQRICELVQMDPLYPLESNLYHQMGIAPLPITTDIAVLKTCLYAEYHVEVPLIDWNRNKFVRISVQGYNTQADLEALHAGLQKGLEINA